MQRGQATAETRRRRCIAARRDLPSLTATTRADLEVPLAATGVDAVTRARVGARTTCIAACV